MYIHKSVRFSQSFCVDVQFEFVSQINTQQILKFYIFVQIHVSIYDGVKTVNKVLQV